MRVPAITTVVAMTATIRIFCHAFISFHRYAFAFLFLPYGRYVLPYITNCDITLNTYRLNFRQIEAKKGASFEQTFQQKVWRGVGSEGLGIH
jgi:hypothetical protein